MLARETRRFPVASACSISRADSAQRWDYNDARLTAPRAIVTSTTDSTITSRWDMGRGTTAGYKQADKTGERINTFRNDVAQVKGAVEGSLKALSALASVTSRASRRYEASSWL